MEASEVNKEAHWSNIARAEEKRNYLALCNNDHEWTSHQTAVGCYFYRGH